jgi:hypothetical protein
MRSGEVVGVWAIVDSVSAFVRPDSSIGTDANPVLRASINLPLDAMDLLSVKALVSIAPL